MTWLGREPSVQTYKGGVGGWGIGAVGQLGSLGGGRGGRVLHDVTVISMYQLHEREGYLRSGGEAPCSR